MALRLLKNRNVDVMVLSVGKKLVLQKKAAVHVEETGVTLRS